MESLQELGWAVKTKQMQSECLILAGFGDSGNLWGLLGKMYRPQLKVGTGGEADAQVVFSVLVGSTVDCHCYSSHQFWCPLLV